MQFPALEVRDLEGTVHVIPDGLPGGPHVIILAFHQWHQSLVGQWKSDLEAWALRHPGTEVWEVPSLSSGYRLFRGSIDGGMRAGIPDPDTRRHTLTAYTDLGALAKDLAIENLDTIQLFLVDCSGTILWRAQGEPSAESLRSLDSATAASAGSEAVASTRAKEKVADYPRPPAIERVDRRLRAAVAGNVIAETDSPIRILETFHPPVYYTRPEDVDMQFLVPSPHTSFCEFKGEAHYYSLVVDGKKQSNVGWYYPHPSPGYEELANHVAFYAWALDEATIDGEQVVPQPGHFYGGWVTSDLEGPFKGEPGTMGW